MKFLLIAFVSFIFNDISYASIEYTSSNLSKNILKTDHKKDHEIQSLTILQRVDHIQSSQLQKRYKQRYWLLKPNEFTDKSPVIFYLCGEASCDEAYVEFMKPWARLINAAIVVVEHRYYGESQPFKQLTTKNLRFLNMEQSLLDYKNLITHLKQNENMNGKWIAVGGSYAGILSSSLRLYFPHLIDAAWASSAPLNLNRYYTKYDENVFSFIGSNCAKKLEAVILYAENILNMPNDLALFKEQILASNLKEDDDFLFGLSDVASAAIQYGYKDFLCTFLEKSSDPIQGYIEFAKDFAANFNYTPESYSFSVATDTNAEGAKSDLRAFYYQQCSELGLFQIASPNLSIKLRSQKINERYIEKNCQKLFGKKFIDQTEKFKKMYLKPILEGKGSEIYYSNGEFDPFVSAGIPKNTNQNIYQIIRMGGFHGDDLFFNESPDSEAKIKELLVKWGTK